MTAIASPARRTATATPTRAPGAMAHTDPAAGTRSGTVLLVAFALAVLIGIVPITLIGSGWWMLPLAVGTLLILAAGVTALLAGILDDDGER
jgi:hypothetical protein